jgi:hypothetical protein
MFFRLKHCLKPKNNVLAVSNNVFSQKTMFKRKKQCLTGKNIRKTRRSVFQQAEACSSRPTVRASRFPEKEDGYS